MAVTISYTAKIRSRALDTFFDEPVVEDQ